MSDMPSRPTDVVASQVDARMVGPGSAPAAQEAAVAAAEAIAAEAAAGIAADARAIAEAVVNAATAAAAMAAARASHTAAEIAAEAAVVARAVLNAASAAAASAATRASQTAAEDVSATALAETAKTRLRNGLEGEAARDTLVNGFDKALRTEWTVFLADPLMPWFSSASEPDTVVSPAGPAGQGLWRDISLARRMEAELRASEAHFEAAFYSAPTAMLVASLVNGRPAQFLHVNHALSLLTGYPPLALLGFGFADLAHPEQPTAEEDLANPRRPEDGEPDERVRRWVHADGHDIWVRIRMAKVRTSGSQTERLVCQIEDVTAPTECGCGSPQQ